MYERFTARELKFDSSQSYAMTLIARMFNDMRWNSDRVRRQTRLFRVEVGMIRTLILNVLGHDNYATGGGSLNRLSNSLRNLAGVSPSYNQYDAICLTLSISIWPSCNIKSSNRSELID